MSPWKVVEHTADVGLEATGDSLEEAIEEAIAGFGGLVCPEGDVQATASRRLEVQARDLDDLVVDLLDEVNYVHQVDHLVPAEATVDLHRTGEGYRLDLELRGEAYDPDRHGHLMEIKATTYHGLEVTEEPARIAVLFDV